MSDLQRSFAKAKLAGLPLEPPLPANALREEREREDEALRDVVPLPDSAQDEDSSSASSASSTGTVKPNRLSFALFARELRKALPDAGILSVDARGHGETIVQTQDGQVKGIPHNLSLKTLSSDLSNMIKLTQAKFDWPRLPDTVLVGHSLGGPVVTDVASTGVLGGSMLGYAVLDVVEGSAMDALQKMNLYLATRPRRFPSPASGIEWHIRSRTLRNTLSARVSVPSILYQKPNHDTSSHDDETWAWRTDLSATEHYWGDWFTGLSKKFLNANGGKLLILAGTDRLDKELMIGQMQGKYQLQVFPDAGHFIQEDQPAKTAMVLDK
ncbi:hypothetical protein Q9189_002741 [Teloschistes chrysophthalmus]